MYRKVITLSVAVLLVIACAATVFAQELDYQKTGSISVTLTEQNEKTPIADACLCVYYIATVGVNTDGKLNYIFTEPFSGLCLTIDDPALVSGLEAYLSENELQAIQLRTDEHGTAVCEQLPLGLYFIRQTGTVEGFAPCTPFLVTVPMQDDKGYVYDVNAAPKTEVAKLTTITIRKVWNTDASAKAADSVTIQLLRNEQVVETAILSEENNWQVTYTDMPESDAYSVEELDVPKGFTATYQQKDYVFTVTNTSTLVQTGQLLWPISVLAAGGMLLLAVGILLLRKKRETNA